jgi:hypothetical protein
MRSTSPEENIMISTQLANGGKVIAEAKRGDAHWVIASF